MTKSVDDVHGFQNKIKNGKKRLRESSISTENKNLILEFVACLRNEDLAKGTIASNLNYATRTAQFLNEIGIDKPLKEVNQGDFNQLMEYLDEKGLKPGTIRNHKKFIKKFFRTMTEDEDQIPKWVKRLKLKNVESQVQKHDTFDTEDLDKLLNSCKFIRDKALIALLADAGIRIGALASCRIKNVDNDRKYGAVIYLSQTSESNKTTAAKGIVLTWSTGYLNQWLSVHPYKNNSEAPLWVTMTKNREPMSYKSLRVAIKRVAKRAGIEKRVNPHKFRHTAITNWILDGLNEQAIKHRAGWGPHSDQMMKIYGNFTDEEMNAHILESYGIKEGNNRQVNLEECPRCHNILRTTDKYCSQCSLVLDSSSQQEIGNYSDKIPEVLKLLMSSEEGKKILDDMNDESKE